MQTDVPDILASRLNFDVIVFRGHTRQEMFLISLVALSLTIFVLGLLAKLFIGTFLIGLGLSFPTAIPVGWMMATLSQTLKAGKPKGYVKQRLVLWLAHHGIKPSPFIHYTGPWTVRRPFK